MPCDCLNARVSAALPEGFPSAVDLVLMRAVKLGEHELSALVSRLSRSGRLLVWSGERSEMRFEGLEAARSVPLGGSRSRRIAEWVPSGRERGDD